MDNNKKTTKFLPQGHAPVVKKQQLSLHTFSDTTYKFQRGLTLLKERVRVQLLHLLYPLVPLSVWSEATQCFRRGREKE